MAAVSMPVYQAERDALIAADRALRFDHQTKHTDALGSNDLIKLADTAIRAVRLEEKDSVWSKETEEVPHIFPGMEFLTCMYDNVLTSLHSPFSFRIYLQ